MTTGSEFAVPTSVIREILLRTGAAGDHLLLSRRAGVLTLSVSSQVDFPLERFLAEAARERLVARVLPHVRDQIRRLAERFLAHYALVRLLTCNTIINNNTINYKHELTNIIITTLLIIYTNTLCLPY